MHSCVDYLKTRYAASEARFLPITDINNTPHYTQKPRLAGLTRQASPSRRARNNAYALGFHCHRGLGWICR
jgi:hypothetical protein